MTSMMAHLQQLAQQSFEPSAPAPSAPHRDHPSLVQTPRITRAPDLKTDSLHLQTSAAVGQQAHIAAAPPTNAMQADAARLVASGAAPAASGFRTTSAAQSGPRGITPQMRGEDAAAPPTQAMHHAALAANPNMRFNPLLAAQIAAARRAHSMHHDHHAHAHHLATSGAHVAEIAHSSGVKHIPVPGALESRLGRMAATVPKQSAETATAQPPARSVVGKPQTAVTSIGKPSAAAAMKRMPPASTMPAHLKDAPKASPFSAAMPFTSSQYAVVLKPAEANLPAAVAA